MAKKSNSVISTLHTVLADTFVLYVNTHAAHWNVTGPQFAALHEMFGTQYEELHASIDELAERLRALQAHAPSGLAELASGSSIKDGAGQGDAMKMIKALLAGHEIVLKSIDAGLEAAEAAGDEGTLDLLTQRQQAHQKTAWMLRAHLA